MMAFLGDLGLAEWLIVIGAICSVTGSLFLGIKQGKQQLEIKDQIIKEQRNLVTGGEGFFFVRPVFDSQSNEIILINEFRGNYPVYDITIDVQEYDRVAEGSSFRYQPSSFYRVQVGTVHPLSASSIFRKEHLPANKDFGKRLFLKISSRNGFVEEDIYLRIAQGRFSQAFKVVQFLPKYGQTTQGLPLDRIEARVKRIDPLFPVAELDHLNGDSGWNRHYQDE